MSLIRNKRRKPERCKSNKAEERSMVSSKSSVPITEKPEPVIPFYDK